MRAMISIAMALGMLLAVPVRAEDAKPESQLPGEIHFVGKNALVTANGEFGKWQFTKVEIDRENLGKSVVELEIQVDSLATGIGMRDNHLKGKEFFDVTNFPVSKIRVHNVQPDAGDGSTTPDPQMFKAKMDIDLHGVQKTVDFEFRMLKQEPLEVEGALTLDRTEFGVGTPHKKLNPAWPYDEIELNFHATVPDKLSAEEPAAAAN